MCKSLKLRRGNSQTNGLSVLEPKVIYFVLQLEKIGCTPLFSCEGHPHNFYIVFKGPMTCVTKMTPSSSQLRKRNWQNGYAKLYSTFSVEFGHLTAFSRVWFLRHKTCGCTEDGAVWKTTSEIIEQDLERLADFWDHQFGKLILDTTTPLI
jgi:hypothetical protein